MTNTYTDTARMKKRLHFFFILYIINNLYR